MSEDIKQYLDLSFWLARNDVVCRDENGNDVPNDSPLVASIRLKVCDICKTALVKCPCFTPDEKFALVWNKQGFRESTIRTIHQNAFAVETGAAKVPEQNPAALPFFQSIALPLAARGLKVMPVRGKKAFLEDHPQKATADVKVICEDWKVYGDCNVAVHCLQEEGGTLIVDADGFDPAAEYKNETGKDAPITYTVQSTPPKDGKVGKTHGYFNQTKRTLALPKNVTEDSTGGKFSLRLKNFYAVGEGSKHPGHGGVLYRHLCRTNRRHARRLSGLAALKG